MPEENLIQDLIIKISEFLETIGFPKYIATHQVGSIGEPKCFYVSKKNRAFKIDIIEIVYRPRD